MVINVGIKKLRKDAIIPEYATDGSAGFDFVAVETVGIYPGETKVIPTGLALSLPEGYELQIRPRSGLSLKSPIRIANSPGTVDSDYRGEIGIIIWNTGDELLTIKKGMKIAQGVIAPVIRANFYEVKELDETNRGAGGFGSTGTFRDNIKQK